MGKSQKVSKQKIRNPHANMQKKALIQSIKHAQKYNQADSEEKNQNDNEKSQMEDESVSNMEDNNLSQNISQSLKNEQSANEFQEADLFQQNQRNLEDYRQEIGNRGVLYISRIPPFMTPNFIRRLLEKNYAIERIYLLPQSEWARKNRIKKGGSKRICFREGWIEFQDKKQAKMAALTLNGQKMVPKKGNFYSEDAWTLKYLPKFKWHHLTQKLAHEERLKKQRLRMQLDQEKKLQQYYTQKAYQSKTIGGIIHKKMAKGKQIRKQNKSYNQTSKLKEQQN